MHLKVSLELPDGTQVHVTHVYPVPSKGDTVFFKGKIYIVTQLFFDYDSSEVLISIDQ